MNQPLSATGRYLILAAAFLVGLMGFTAFAIDLGYIAMVRTQLHAASDGSALAACLELAEGLGPATSPSQTTVANTARSAATTVASANPNGEKSSVYIDTGSMQFGRRTFDGASWSNSWGTQPYNLVRVVAGQRLRVECAAAPLHGQLGRQLEQGVAHPDPSRRGFAVQLSEVGPLPGPDQHAVADDHLADRADQPQHIARLAARA